MRQQGSRYLSVPDYPPFPKQPQSGASVGEGKSWEAWLGQPQHLFTQARNSTRDLSEAYRDSRVVRNAGAQAEAVRSQKTILIHVQDREEELLLPSLSTSPGVQGE